MLWYQESTCSMMMDVILPCFDIHHVISVHTHWQIESIDLFCALFFLTFFPSRCQLCFYTLIANSLDQWISEAFTCIHWLLVMSLICFWGVLENILIIYMMILFHFPRCSQCTIHSRESTKVQAGHNWCMQSKVQGRGKEGSWIISIEMHQWHWQQWPIKGLYNFKPCYF